MLLCSISVRRSMEKNPCEECPSMAICRLKVRQCKGFNLWDKLWSFIYDKQEACEKLFDYASLPRPVLNVKRSTDVLTSMQLIYKNEIED